MVKPEKLIILYNKISLTNLKIAFILLINGEFFSTFSILARQFLRGGGKKPICIAPCIGNSEEVDVKNRLCKQQHIDIIIPVYNGFDLIKQLFESIFTHTRYPFKLIVIDDASTDTRVWPFLKKINSDYPWKVLLLKNNENLGFVKSVNRGYKFTTGHFVILNTDTEVPEGWLERLMRPIFGYPDIASATPFTNAGKICGFPIPDKDGPIFENLGLNEINDYFKNIIAKSNYHAIPTGVGFCMGINKNAAEKIGMFDSETFSKGYSEENDWCMRAKKFGYKNVIVPNLFVFHKHGGSFNGNIRDELRNKNFLKLIIKHPDYLKTLYDFNLKDPLRLIRDFLIFQITINRDKSKPVLLITREELGLSLDLHKISLINFQVTKKYEKHLNILYNVKKHRFIIKYSYGDYKLVFSAYSLENINQLIDLINVKIVIKHYDN